MGPFTGAWRKLARQTKAIHDIPADASTRAYSAGGNNTGVAAATYRHRLTFDFPQTGAAGTSAGQVIEVIQAGTLLGRFGRIELPAGVNASPVYAAGGMSLRVQ